MKLRLMLVLAVLCCAAASGVVSREAYAAPAQFDPTGSDPEAIAAVDKVQQALGMPGAWGKAHYVEFTFGSAKGDTMIGTGRRHCWDTWTNRYRVEGTARQTGQHYVVIFKNINDPSSAQVWINGDKQTADTTVAKWGKNGYGAYINDSYWALMPYKMKDPGVHLRWMGVQRDSVSGKDCPTVRLSFEDVGLTPKDHYLVWIDPQSNMVERWKYFSGEDSTQTTETAWNDYTDAGPLKVSTKRPIAGKAPLAVVVRNVVASETVNEKAFEGP